MNVHASSATQNRLRRRAQQYIQARQPAAAQAALESLLQQVPDDAHARFELARVMLQRGHLRDANRQLLRIAQTPPDDVQLLLPLVQHLHMNGEMLAARACLDHLDTTSGQSAELLAAQAQLRWMLGEIPKATALIERAMEAGIDSPDAYYLQAMLLQFSGDIDAAGDLLQASLLRWPGFGAAAVVLSGLRKQTGDSNHLEFLQGRLDRLPAAAASREDKFLRAQYESALFKELDDLGRHDEAWAALARCNALMHAITRYDAASETAVTDAIIAASTLIDARETASAPVSDGPIPIFIVGMPRAGSTLLDRMLSSHSAVASAGEINDFLCQLRWATDAPPGGVQGMLKMIERSPDIDFAEVGARYLEQTRWRAQGHRYYIDKLPGNVRVVNLIHRALPHAPILHAARDPMDLCFSNFKAMFGQASAHSYDMRSLAHYHAQYQRLVAHWRASLGGAMLDVPYAALTRDPEAIMRKVLQHCGLAMEEACLNPERNAAPVSTRSTAQVREPIHTRNIGQWRNYEEQLQPLREAIEKFAPTSASGG